MARQQITEYIKTHSVGDVISYEPLMQWPVEKSDRIEFFLPQDLSAAEMNEFFYLLILNTTESEEAIVWFTEDNPLILDPSFESVRRFVAKSGYLDCIWIKSQISFNFKKKDTCIRVEYSEYADVEEMSRKHYVFDRSVYLHPYFAGKPGFEFTIPFDDVAEMVYSLSDDDLADLAEKDVELYRELFCDCVGSNAEKTIALQPQVSLDFKRIIGEDAKEVYENYPEADKNRLYAGPCILLFNYQHGLSMKNEMAVIREKGTFLLSSDVYYSYGEPYCIKPKEGVSLEYLALCLYVAIVSENNCLWEQLVSPAFMKYGTSILDIAFNPDVKAQEKALVSALNSFSDKGKANVLVVGDADLAADFDSIVCDLNLNILGTLDAADFDEDTVDQFMISADSAVDAVIVCADSYDVLKKIGRHRSSKALRDIMFFFLHNLEENAVESYIDAYDAEQDRTRFFTDVRLLLEKLRFEVSDSPTEEYLLRNSHKEEFSALELLNDEMIPALLTSSLKAGEQSEQTLRLNFNTLRKILDSVFAEWRKLVPASVNSDAFNNLKLGAIVELLRDERVVSERRTGYYLTTRGYMPNPLALSLCYLVDIANNDSHTTELVRYMHATKRNNLYRSCVEILLDVLCWFRDVHEREIPLKSFNLYEYSPIVEIDAEGIAHCGQVKLKGKDSTNVEVKAGDKVTIRTFAVNNDDKYMFYTTNYQIVR